MNLFIIRISMIPTKFNKLKITQDDGLRKLYLISCSPGPAINVYNNGKIICYLNYYGLANQQYQYVQYCKIQNGITLGLRRGGTEDDNYVIFQIYANQNLVMTQQYLFDISWPFYTLHLPKIDKNQNYYFKIYAK